MIKRILFGVLFVLGLNASAQIDGRIITNHVSTDDMVWSDLEDKFMFFRREERHIQYALIETKLNKEMTGRVTITLVESESVYTFTVYDYSIRQPEVGEMMFLECIEISTGDKCTIIFHQIDNTRVISVMMPGANLAVYFDNMEDQ